MPRISLTILSPAREFIDIIPDPWEVKYLDEVKGDCSGSFKIPFDYKRLVDTPAIKQKRNVVQVVVDGNVEGAWLMRNWHVVLSGSGEKAALYWEFSGPGLREWLHDAVVYPAAVFHAVSQPLPNDAQVIVGASSDNSGVITGTTTSGGGTTTSSGPVSVDYIGTSTPQDAGAVVIVPPVILPPIPTPPVTTTSITTMRGINSAGGGFGNSSTSLSAGGQYGTAWHFDSQASFNYLASRGTHLIRLSIAWEHMQPTLGGALDATAVGYLTAALDRIQAAGMTVILDLHNYGQYATADSGYAPQTLGQGVVTDAHFTDVWTRLVTALKSHPAVLGWGLMNEPHNLYDTSLTNTQRANLWRTATNNCVQAIRATGDTHVITVMDMAIYGSNWTTWTWNPAAWISDPLNDREKIWYEQHLYQDANRGGQYPDSYATELASAQSSGYASIFDRTMAHYQAWFDWISSNNVRGFIGEYGVPCDTDASSWATEADKMLTVFDSHNVHYTWWSAGEWFHQYKLAPYVQPTTNTGAISIARPPVSTVLESHLN